MTQIACLLLLLFWNDFVTFKKDNKSPFFIQIEETCGKFDVKGTVHLKILILSLLCLHTVFFPYTDKWHKVE